jgi:hypothetical protein
MMGTYQPDFAVGRYYGSGGNYQGQILLILLNVTYSSPIVPLDFSLGADAKETVPN